MSSLAGERQKVTGAQSDARVPVLDGLRGLAIALVMMNNSFPEKLTFPPMDIIAVHISRFGWIGVDLFFVLSGFLITGILCDTKGAPHYFRNFYARRVLRIFPLYYTVLVAVFIVAPHLGAFTADQMRRLHQQQWYYWTYLANLGTMMHGGTDVNIGHFWSLAVEEQFYVGWPLLVLLIDRRRLIALCVALMVASCALRAAWLAQGLSGDWVYVGTPFRIDGLAVGAMIALIMRAPGGMERLVRWARGVGRGLLPLGVVLVAWFEMTHTDASSFACQVVGYPLLALGFGTLLVRSISASPTSRVSRLFSSNAMRILGRYSYALYIFHALVLQYLNEHMPWTLMPPLVWGSHVPIGILVIPLVAVLSFVLALLSWNLLEKPFLSLKRYFPYSRVVRQAPHVAPVAVATS
jgi:peptidoglycan/LPS O-acetylase OafA/YrhL